MTSYSESSDEEFVTQNPPLDPYRSLGSWSTFRFPDLIVPEAFMKVKFSIPAQLASATGTPIDKVMSTFDEIFGGRGWRDKPALTSKDVLAYAEETKVSVYMYQGRRLDQFIQRETNGVSIVFTTWCGLFYFYKGMGPVSYTHLTLPTTYSV